MKKLYAHAKDLTGQRFGYLTVLNPTDKRSSGSVVWDCICDCGNHKEVRAIRLLSGEVDCCGHHCTAKQRNTKQRNNGNRINAKHYYKERLYRVWQDMKCRCHYPSSGKSYKNYGGRGITVCEEWNKSYEAFRTWAHENGYDENAPRGQCTLDRIDVNGNYEPSNCRWVSMKLQNNNRRNNVKRECVA